MTFTQNRTGNSWDIHEISGDWYRNQRWIVYSIVEDTTDSLIWGQNKTSSVNVLHSRNGIIDSWPNMEGKTTTQSLSASARLP